MQDNNAKRTLRAGGTVLAISLNFVNPGLAEYLGRLGFGCIVMEGEHGGIVDSDVENVARACDLTGVTPILRLPVNNALMQRYLALGMMGFHVPQVQSGAQAREVVDAVKFAPLGARGLGSFRAGDYGLSLGGWPAFIERANAETLVLVAIEDPQGIAALPDILAIEEIDVVLIGTTDLSCSLGVPGQTKHPEVVKAVDAAIAQIRAAGKIAGLPAATGAELRSVHERGARYVLTSVPRMLVPGATELMSVLKEL